MVMGVGNVADEIRRPHQTGQVRGPLVVALFGDWESRALDVGCKKLGT